MGILDFFWTFYLNHLSPLQGYFWLKESKSKGLQMLLDIFQWVLEWTFFSEF